MLCCKFLAFILKLEVYGAIKSLASNLRPLGHACYPVDSVLAFGYSIILWIA